jgi:plasmid rolling circle replication initiator protein Rep
MRLDSAHEIYLTEISPKDKPWDKHRANAVIVAQNYAEGGSKYTAHRISKCSRNLDMVTLPDASGTIAYKLRHTEFCRVRHCPVCQWRRSMKWSSRMRQGLPKLLADYPKACFLFLTLTVPNCRLVNLRATFAIMNEGFVRMSQLKKFPGIGWVKAAEVTRNPQTFYAHPHFHILIMVPSSYFGGNRYIKQEEWTEMWKQSMRFDFDPIVNIKRITPKKKKKKEENGMEENGREWSKMEENGMEENPLIAAICETVKYSVKEEDLKVSSSWLVELTRQVHKTQATTLGGVFRHYFRDERESDDLIHVNGELKISREEFNDMPGFDFGFNERKWKYLMNT